MNNEVIKEIVWHTLERCDSSEQRQKVMMTFIRELGSEFVSQVIQENDKRFNKVEE